MIYSVAGLGVHFTEVHYYSSSLCRFTTVVQGHEFTLVVNDNLGTQRNAGDEGWCEASDPPRPPLSFVPLSPLNIFAPFPSLTRWEDKGPLLQTHTPSSHPFLLSVLPTAGPCYPQSSGAIHQHDKGVKRELGRGNKSCVEDPRMKRLLVAQERKEHVWVTAETCSTSMSLKMSAMLMGVFWYVCNAVKYL